VKIKEITSLDKPETEYTGILYSNSLHFDDSNFYLLSNKDCDVKKGIDIIHDFNEQTLLPYHSGETIRFSARTYQMIDYNDKLNLFVCLSNGDEYKFIFRDNYYYEIDMTEKEFDLKNTKKQRMYKLEKLNSSIQDE